MKSCEMFRVEHFEVLAICSTWNIVHRFIYISLCMYDISYVSPRQGVASRLGAVLELGIPGFWGGPISGSTKSVNHRGHRGTQRKAFQSFVARDSQSSLGAYLANASLFKSVGCRSEGGAPSGQPARGRRYRRGTGRTRASVPTWLAPRLPGLAVLPADRAGSAKFLRRC